MNKLSPYDDGTEEGRQWRAQQKKKQDEKFEVGGPNIFKPFLERSAIELCDVHPAPGDHFDGS